jgi:hypothetical protein
MLRRRHILLGFLAAYLTLCVGAATGVTLPGNHSFKGFEPSLAFFAFGGSIEAVYDCPNKKVQIVAHDTTGNFRATGKGNLVFMQASMQFLTEWTFDRQNSQSDQVIATVSTAITSGTWTVHLQEDPSESTTFTVPSGPCPTPTATPSSQSRIPRQSTGPTVTPTPAVTPARTPTPTPSCRAQFVYDPRTRSCVPIGTNGGLG